MMEEREKIERAFLLGAIKEQSKEYDTEDEELD